MVVTHAAITGYGDAQDNAHRGFDCFLDLVQEYHPTYFCHGHVHRSYGWDIPRSLECGSTTVINAFERYTLEIDEDRVRAMRESTSPAHRFRISWLKKGCTAVPVPGKRHACGATFFQWRT